MPKPLTGLKKVLLTQSNYTLTKTSIQVGRIGMACKTKDNSVPYIISKCFLVIFAIIV
jgi:hypothetical protein